MKLPVVWITAAFAAGIVLANAVPGNSHGVNYRDAWVAASIGLMAAGGLLIWRGFAISAWTCALAAWCAIGGAAVQLERASVPANHVARLISENHPWHCPGAIATRSIWKVWRFAASLYW